MVKANLHHAFVVDIISASDGSFEMDADLASRLSSRMRQVVADKLKISQVSLPYGIAYGNFATDQSGRQTRLVFSTVGCWLPLESPR